ncbi:3-methyl-2-oxobutanoate hydroxymethyltransferase [Streptomyces cellulosae]|uniref:3-methyl-2-oxobutanoate hydroxymethyltransferase n=3 Tax=Streptomyces TaxID=1883 RepID=A0ABU3JFU6_9ACTN|nr:3-methyl-2-oxobutanoate hydroxymethyltransferase [Streptomyces sp. McG8]MDQ0490077.1 3-methyl-2-oxobutanoate hydroxymethyltransferase [Streptomyces thermodiastaticus]MDT6972636.1 3-methyl-2-oxobutanoate hydroxymethyltransferase [Streptomyces thermocarboxydus]WSB52756.1 3-methyl-2-oxobutanoate hydroxymethyltransferase [Streptomyces cellulosae]WSB89567.1 3-methyl-2-oxobutanoate hydroxymethyltransferase [Streptomyces cellulosae]
MSRMTLPKLQAMKAAGEKSVCIVAWDYHMARIADRAGADIVSVGDSVGVNLWGRPHPLEIRFDELLVVAKAVRRGVADALVSCDFPFGPLQTGHAVPAAVRLAKEAGVDLVKLDGAADFPEAVEAVTRAGVPVFAQFGITPQTALKYGIAYSAAEGAFVPDELLDEMVDEARRLESAGAVALNFTNSGPVVGPAVVEAVSIPVLGGFGGGPWLDGRIRMSTAAIGYNAKFVDQEPHTYANVARVAYDAIAECVADIRGGRNIRGQ